MREVSLKKKKKIKKQRLDAPTNTMIIRMQQTTLASYLVPWRIAGAKKAHNIGKESIKPAALDMVRTIYGNEFAKKLKNVPLSNDALCVNHDKKFFMHPKVN